MDETASAKEGSSTEPSHFAPTAAPLDPELESRLHALHAAEDRRNKLAARIRKERRVLLPVLGLCLMALPNFRMAKVQGHSMEPRYTTGDTLVLLKTFRLFTPIKVGDIVVIHLKHGKTEGEEIVKRVIFVQNEKGNAPWPDYIYNSRGRISTERWFPEYKAGTEVVPAGAVMVMGDNTMNSMDSRDFGPVLDDEIEGKVLNP
jgi:signal peptidase I